MEVSVVVPTCGRKKKLIDCLSSLAKQNYPLNKFEVIVVDDRANKEIKKLIFQIKFNFGNLVYVSQLSRGPAVARNLGVEAAQGKIVLFTDDDCVAEKNWVELMVKIHKDNPDVSAVGGGTYSRSPKIAVLVSQFLSTCSINTNIDGKEEIIFFPTCNVSLKREIFEKYKFDKDFPLPGGEDLDFFWRLFKDGHRFIWDKKIRVIHYREDTFISFLEQAYIYGRGNLLTKYKNNSHVLLKELKIGRSSFWLSTLGNLIKIPRFSCILGKQFLKHQSKGTGARRITVYIYFALHKIFYIFGNIHEYFRIQSGNVKQS